MANLTEEISLSGLSPSEILNTDFPEPKFSKKKSQFLYKQYDVITNEMYKLIRREEMSKSLL